MKGPRVYCKLVRDRVPEELSGKPIRYETQRVKGESYRQALLEKLIEEANEALEAGDSAETLMMELVDVFEVLDTLCDTYGIRHLDVFRHQSLKRKARGGFTNGTMLLWVQDIDLVEVPDAYLEGESSDEKE